MSLMNVKRPAAVRQHFASLTTLLAAFLVLGSGALGAEAPSAKKPSAASTKSASQALSVTTDLEQTAGQQGSVTAAGVRWTCKGRRCTAQLPSLAAGSTPAAHSQSGRGRFALTATPPRS